MLGNWFNKSRDMFRKKSVSQELPGYGALFDISSYALLCLHKNGSAVNFLTTCFPDAVYLGYINYPNYKHSFFLLDVPASQYPEWSFDRSKKKFVPSRADLVTDSLRDMSKLAVAKCDVAAKMMQTINSARFRKSTGILHQEYVYITKRMQAERFRDSGYNEDQLLNYPYVLQYADFAEITPRAAADEILFKARLHDEDLARSELMRIKYFGKLKELKRPEEAPKLFESFMLEFSENAKV